MSKTRKKYDFVLSCRFDLVFLSKFLNFENFCKEDFYITHWWQNICKYGYNDPWFVCNKENMKKIAKINASKKKTIQKFALDQDEIDNIFDIWEEECPEL